MSPKDEYFDWVSERKKCSLQYKFEELKIHAEKNAATAGFEYQTNGEFFVLSRSGKRARSVTFNLDLTKDHVLVKSTPAHFAAFKITLGLNDSGECRYRLNGEGEYKCWQVLHRVLERVFFQPDDSETSGTIKLTGF